MINYLAFILMIVLLSKLLYNVLKYFQDCNYRPFFGKYLKYYYLKLSLVNFLILFLFFYSNKYIDELLISVIFIMYQLLFIYVLDKIKYISELNYSKRMIRLITFTITLITVCFFILKKYLYYLYSFIVVLYLLPFLTGLALLIVSPIEKIIMRKYLVQAQKKLNEYKPVVIGITGSAGKTSIKYYLYELLKDKYVTYKTKKSYNTINGINITINDELKCHNALLILEMGATHKNDIATLKHLYKPKYAIISDIFPQHLKTFKNMETIVKEKMSLLDCEVVILNNDNEYIKNYPINVSSKIIKYGFEETNDYYYQNVISSIGETSFDLYKNKHFFMHVKTKIIGRHNVNNLIASIILADILNIEKTKIIDKLAILENFEHRLSLRKNEQMTIIDDSYNSNVNGFKNALALLNDAKNKKTLLTPGIVETGKMTKAINLEIASEIVKNCDQVILVKNPNSRFLYKSLKELNYQNIEVVSSFKEGFKKVNEGTVLIENDLTDNYFL